MRGKFETEIAELTRELDTMRDKWSKSRDEAAKREEELIVVKALLKTKEVALYGAQEVSQILCILQHFLLLFHSVWKSLKKSHFSFFLRTGHDAARLCTTQRSAVPCRAITQSKQNSQ